MENVSGCYIVYKTVNVFTGKYYIGQHYQEISGFDGYLGSGKIFKRSINKYGEDNFIRETLEYCTSANINEREVYWIAELSARDKNIGYNLTKGGEGTRGLIMSEETKLKISKANKGKSRKRINIKPITEEHKQNIIRANKKRIGIKCKEETKKKLSENHKGFKHTEKAKLKIKEKWKMRKMNKQIYTKYNYIMSNGEDYFNYFSYKERGHIKNRMNHHKTNTIEYNGIVIERRHK